MNSLFASSVNSKEPLDIKEVFISIEVKNASIIEVFEQIESKTAFTFSYEKKDLDSNVKINLISGNLSVAEILQEVSSVARLNFKQVDNTLNVIKMKEDERHSYVELQPAIAVGGTVVSMTDNSALPGVTVYVKGTSNGTVTDMNGRYSISVPDEYDTLVFSFVGFLTKEVPVNGRTTINVELAEDVKNLEEVVVVGYGTQRKSDVTGALAVISTKEFEEQPLNRVDQVLQGRAAGVQVTQAGGAPGGESRVRIRGANSVLGNNDPLYVVDGFVGADFNMVNPNDIETIQVLKDAASTSIYGSRGANGVVIITTKKGSKGDFRITYEGQASISEVIRKWDVLGAAEFAEIANLRSEAMGTAPIFTQAQLDEINARGGTDWQDLIFRNAWGQQHQLGVSGGSEKTSFLVSANYVNMDGIIENTGFKRYIIRSNVASQVNDKLSLRLNLSGSRIENHNTGLQRGTGNPVVQALAWAPTTPAYDANGKILASDPVGSVMTNPVALLYDRANDNQRNILNVIGGVNYALPIEGLSLDLQYAVNYLNGLSQTFNGMDASRNNPNASRSSSEQVTLQSTNALNYDRTFNKIHHLNVVGVFETQQFTNNNFSATGNTLKFPSLGYYNLPLANSYTVGSGFSKWSLLSYLGRVNYSFREKYLLSASVRRDGSSKFAEDNRYSVFPSMAAGYVLSEESFINNLNIFSTLKLRGSWGMTGSQAINPYATLSTYNTNAPVAFNNNGITSGIMLGNPGNPNLRWETTEQLDLGLEMGFFRGRINIEADYFIKNTSDLLLNQALPAYAGGGTQTKNVGEIQNKGFEVSVSAIVFDSEKLNWTSNFNLSNVKNRVVSLGGIATQIPQGTNVGAGMSTTSEFMLIPGYSLGSYWGIKYLGTWKPDEVEEADRYNAVPGDSRYEDLNGDGKITTDDFQIIGKGIPTTTAGWNNTVSYGNFTLNMFFQGVFGIDKLNYTRAAAMSGSGDARQYILSEIRDRYIPGVNETSDIPAFSSSNVVYTQSSRFIESGDFVRLKNISLAYTLPPSVMSSGNLRFFLSATNLLTITNYKGIDPESSNIGSATDAAQGIDYGAYPNAKTYTAGINLTF